MKKIYYLLIMTVAGLGLLSSCGNTATRPAAENNISAKKIMQQPDGTISLQLDKADCYSDIKDPSENTAEWNVVVSKSGRYNVWLSSATRDTTDLNYKSKVLVSVQDTRIEGVPACDKIIRNSGEVSFPYFRADSFIGSMYIKDTGEFHIQVISEQILPEDVFKGDVSKEDLSKLLSVSFTPVKR
jgi:hypothetical protein